MQMSRWRCGDCGRRKFEPEICGGRQNKMPIAVTCGSWVLYLHDIDISLMNAAVAWFSVPVWETIIGYCRVPSRVWKRLWLRTWQVRGSMICLERFDRRSTV